MPTVHKIGRIKIDVYSNDHLPPHFHALYQSHMILVEIRTLETFAGSLPPRQYREVIAWASQEGIQEKLEEIYKRLNPRHYR